MEGFRPALQSSRVILVAWILFSVGGAAQGGEAQWIWSPAFEKELAEPGVCFFRKSFTVAQAEQAEIQISADDQYELYVNGRQIGAGKNWKVMEVYDLARHLVAGKNTIAVKATNLERGSAGLAARVLIKEPGNTHVTYSSDNSWKTSLKEFPQWQKGRFDDSQWLAARSFGDVGATLPWGNEVTVAGVSGRFKAAPEFHVEPVVGGKETGSLIAMTFDEFGQIVASRENGPLILIRDDDRDGRVDTVTTLCDRVTNCQGILCLSGKIFVVGQGPQGTALYKLSDDDQDGRVERVESILRFKGEMGEHGPHAILLGPDGLLYIVAGNFTTLERNFEASSPHWNYYEGDLITPKYEDAGGHAAGIKAPGGTILRTDTSGSAVELFAGGLQNPYDIAFSREGELFTADSDMEWDSGMSWYRPTRINHAIPGGEFGWRSGWSKWPDYFPDNLPAVLETGRGSPTGIEAYNHHMYPSRYHNALFIGDWSRGRILAARLRPHGATFKATTEVFLEGTPLNVTDLAVGPDGALYFCTGGRDSEGGLYRVVWNGDVPPEVKAPGKGIEAALKQPQLQSAWARQRLAVIKQQLGKQWAADLTAVAVSNKHTPEQRVRALDLLQLFGPAPTIELLQRASRDAQSTVRCKAAYLLGVLANDAAVRRLDEMLSDKDPMVQRCVCEALRRAGKTNRVEPILALTGSDDRHVAWAARKLLEQIPYEQWQVSVLDAKTPRLFLNGSLSLLVVDPPEETTWAIVDRCSQLMEGYLSDQDFLDLLRVLQVAFLQGDISGDKVPELRRQLSEEYPSQDRRMNRELTRLLVYLQDPTVAPRFIEQLESDIPNVEKMHIATLARYLRAGWTTQNKLDLLEFFEEARALPGGHSFTGYIENISRDFFAEFSDEDRSRVLAEGHKWPSSALSMLARLPENVDADTLLEIENLDRQVQGLSGEPARRLRIGIAAVLGNSGNEQAMAYLRGVYENEPDRRVTIAMALAQHPGDENWPLLVRSLSIVEGAAAQEVLMKLADVDRKPDKPEPIRQAIIRGLMLRDAGAPHAMRLLEHWTGEQLGKPDDNWEVALGRWQQWFSELYPLEPEAKLPAESEKNQWTYQELLSHLSSAQAESANARRGLAAFEKAQCAKCHRCGDYGESVGPDLSTVAQRFQRKEILESILFPSHVISDQYVSYSLSLKSGKVVTGMVGSGGDDMLTVLQSNGEKITVKKDDVEEQARSKVSAMPEGLLNQLTLDEIADLFRFLASPPQAEVAGKSTNGRAKLSR